MNRPGVPRSPGVPLFEQDARDALRAAQERIGIFTGKGLPPFPPVPREEREEALADAGNTACRFCAGFHAGASTPACPRLATFKLNGDLQVIEGSFWPDGISEYAVETGPDGAVTTIVKAASQWDTAKVVAVADMAEEEEGDDGAPDAQRA